MKLLFLLLLATAVSWAQPLQITPAEQEKVTEDRPCVQVSWPAGQLQAGRCRLWFQGKEVTSECLRSADFLSFRPFRSPPAGPIEVRFEAENLQGQTVSRSWTFVFAPQSWIESVEHNAVADLFEGDVLEVKARGRSGGKARFQVEGMDSVAMAETSPGQYLGTYLVNNRDTVLSKPLKVMFQSGSHRETVQAELPVKIFGGFYRPRVSEPADGSLVEQSFILRGKARPGSRVSILPKIGFGGDDRAPTSNSEEVGGTAGSFPAEVDSEGNFQAEYGVPVLLPGMTVVITVYALDPDGTRSAPTVVRYRFK